MVFKLEEEKKLKQKDFESAINNKSLTIDKQNEQLAMLENALDEAEGNYQSFFFKTQKTRIMLTHLKRITKSWKILFVS